MQRLAARRKTPIQVRKDYVIGYGYLVGFIVPLASHSRDSWAVASGPEEDGQVNRVRKNRI